MRFPFTKNGVTFSGCIPGAANQLRDMQVLVTSTITDPLSPSAEGMAQTVSVPRVSGLPLRGISLSPDSDLSCCDIYPGGRVSLDNQWRISAGNPFIGELPNDFMAVTVPMPMPTLDGGNVWNGAEIGANTTSAHLLGIPLRLRLWWGDVTPVSGPCRAPLHATYRMRVPNPGDVAIAHVVTEGRRRVKVTAFTAAATNPTISVNAMYSSVDTANPRIDQGPTVVLLAPTAIAIGAMRVFDFGDLPIQGGGVLESKQSPIPVTQIIITDATGTTSHIVVDVYAWD